jgi:putative transposase
MPNYRRAFVPGGCWFFTVNLLERRTTTLGKIEQSGEFGER